MGAPLFEQSSYLGMPMTSIATSASTHDEMAFGPEIACGGLVGRLRFIFHNIWRAMHILFIRAGFSPNSGVFRTT
jgi:hypothetical protein